MQSTINHLSLIQAKEERRNAARYLVMYRETKDPFWLNMSISCKEYVNGIMAAEYFRGSLTTSSKFKREFIKQTLKLQS